MGKSRNQKDTALGLAGLSPLLLDMAEVIEPVEVWADIARAYLDERYQRDPFQILHYADLKTSGYDAQDMRKDNPLAEFKRDFARWLVLDHLDGVGELAARQQALFQEAAQIKYDSSFTLALARAGADLLNTRLGDRQDSVLMRAATVAPPAELLELLGYIPAEQRAAHVNLRNKAGVSAVHMLALESEAPAANLAVLQAAGADLSAVVFHKTGTSARLQALNVAQLAVMMGRPALTAALMAQDRSLFVPAAATPAPDQIGEKLVSRMIEAMHLRRQQPALVFNYFAAPAASFTADENDGLVFTIPPELDDVKIATNLAAMALDRQTLPYGDVQARTSQMARLAAPVVQNVRILLN